MRLLAAIIFIFLVIPCCSQSPVTVTARWESQTREAGQLMLQAEAKPGWRVYYRPHAAAGIEGLVLRIDHSGLEASGAGVLQSGAMRTITDSLFDRERIPVVEGAFRYAQAFHVRGKLPARLPVKLQVFASKGDEFIPVELELTVITDSPAGEQKEVVKFLPLKPGNRCATASDQSTSLWAIFWIGFGGGLIALLTPCIFPMIPVTVSFFTGKAKTRREGLVNAGWYAGWIVGIYALASAPFHLLGNINPQIFNTIATHPWVNVFFFIIFILFALSFFGVFEIRLPPGIANRAGAKSGSFFMALTLVIVSFSCTGIILGSLLVNALSSGGSAWQLSAGMTGFGTALALPFGLFALFPQWLRKLPRSGGWLGTVKVSLAFIELALALKFLSNADLVEHWGLLKREVFIGLWILIFLGLAAYLLNLGWRKRYGTWNVSKGRLVFGVGALLFALVLLPGLTNTSYARLSWLSGFPPPLSYSVYGEDAVRDKGVEPDVLNDYDKALALAREQNKPLLIDFTGWACVNCRKMEEQIWTRPRIQQLIEEKFILVSLYVDDRRPSPDGGTIGEKWAKFQADHFWQVTQPLYVLVSPGEEILSEPVGYTPDEEAYKKWLECGLAAFREP